MDINISRSADPSDLDLASVYLSYAEAGLGESEVICAGAEGAEDIFAWEMGAEDITVTS